MVATSSHKTAAQVRQIWGRARTRGMTDEELHLLVERETGTASIAALTFDEANRVIHALGGTPFVKGSRRTQQLRRQRAGIRQMAPLAQIELIARLATARGMSPDGLTRLIRRIIRKDRPATTVEANKVIEALKAMNAREGINA
jgi:hypothetical protein